MSITDKKLTVAIGEKNYGAAAFLPILALLILYLGGGLFFTLLGVEKPFLKIPRDVAVIVGVVVALFMGRRSFAVKADSFAKHCADQGVMIMCLIFILAGMFAGVTKAMGGVQSSVNLGLSFIPLDLLVAGVFLICVFVSTAMGTCLGTIAAICPIAIGLAETAGLNMTYTMTAVIGGSMFGDNLSIISDTTIAATRGAGCEMKDKFRMNLKIAAPAAILATIVYAYLGGGSTNDALTGTYEYSLIKVVPYVVVLVTAVMGMNVMQVLIGGIVLSGLIGGMTGSMTFVSFCQAAASGISGMMSLVLIAILLRGLIGLAQDMGGLAWLVSLFDRNIKTRRGGQYSIAGLVSLFDIALANNTVSIIISVPFAKPIAKKFGIAPQRLASLLDIFACIIPGISPLSSAILLVLTLTPEVTPLGLMTYAFYPYFLFIATVITIHFNLLQTKEEKEGASFYPELDEG
jgi:Na+/H+ antiporter NhaC